MPCDRRQAIDAYNVLNQMVGDVVSATRSRDLFGVIYQEDGSPEVRICFNRMCLSHIFLTLTKWKEFYERFHGCLPAEMIPACRELLREIKRKRLLNFRNTVVGHVWDKTRNGVVTPSDTERRFQEIVENDVEQFCLWINNPENNVFPNTVVSIFETLRDSIRQEYGLQNQEIFDRA